MVNKIDTLKVELAKPEYGDLVATQNYSGIAQLLNNKPLIPNSVPQQQLPKTVTIENVIGLVTPQERFAISETRTYDRMLDAANQGRFDWVLGNLETLLGGGVISQGSYDGIVAKFQETELDPNYQTQILGQSKAEELGIYPVSEIDVQGALN